MNLGPHPFSLRQLQYAVAVAEHSSFRKAAERCHVSQPALSAQIAELEDALGTRLFERDRKKVLLTASGRTLIERARVVLRDADDLVELASRAKDPFSGAMRIGVIPTVAPYLLSRLGPAIRAAYPQLTVIWTEDRTGALVARLEEGALDAALVALEADVGELDHEIIGHDPFVLATPLEHPLGKTSAPVKASELRDVPVLLLDDGHCFREQALTFCSSARAEELEFRATSLSTLAQMVADGAGVTLLPELAVPTESRRAQLRIRPFAAPAPGRTLALVWRKRSPLEAAFRRLAATARAAFSAAEASAHTSGRERRKPKS